MHNDNAPLSFEEFIELTINTQLEIEGSIRSMFEKHLDGTTMPKEQQGALVEALLQAVRHLGDSMYVAGLRVGHQANTEGKDINTFLPPEVITDENRRQMFWC